MAMSLEEAIAKHEMERRAILPRWQESALAKVAGAVAREAVAMRQASRAAFPSEAELRAMKPILDAARCLPVPRQ